MNIEQYIESGVLELYVLDQLDTKERIQVEAMQKQHPKIAAEIISIEIALEKLMMQNKKQAKQSILQNGHKTIASDLPQQLRNDSDLQTSIPLQTNNQVFSFSKLKLSMLGLAAGMALLVCGASIYFLYNKLEKSNAQLVFLQTELQKSNTAVSIISNSAFTKIDLPNIDTSNKEVFAQVYWNKESKDVFVHMTDAKAQLNPDQQYQLWALEDGIPVDAGIFETIADLQKAKSISKAQAFAITIEKKGGSSTPNLKALVAMGKL
jgi:anti-sigma-K factor RskA